jgi:nucleoside-diphosphate-sugar epimerase
VKAVVEQEKMRPQPLHIITTPSDDLRSYHISSDKIQRDLGFTPKRTIEDAVRDLCRAFKEGKFADSMQNSRYFNIKRMQEVQLV